MLLLEIMQGQIVAFVMMLWRLASVLPLRKLSWTVAVLDVAQGPYALITVAKAPLGTAD